MRGYRSFAMPPAALRRAKLDNVAIVPASLLPFKVKWQAIANTLPAGNVLIILPTSHNSTRKALETVINLLRDRGRYVATVSAERFV